MGEIFSCKAGYSCKQGVKAHAVFFISKIIKQKEANLYAYEVLPEINVCAILPKPVLLHLNENCQAIV